MRSIVNIDYTDTSCDGAFNAAVEGNELLLCIRPLAIQRTNYKVEVTEPNGTVHVSNVIIASGGLDQRLVEYFVPVAYWSKIGTMKVRLLSTEGNSVYTSFTCINVNTGDDICCKLTKGMFMFHLCGKADPVIELLYPVGTVITNAKATFNPNDAYVGTKWERIKGRVVVGVDEADADFNTTGKTSGSKTFNNQHRHGTQSHTLTIAEMPRHGHGYRLAFGGNDPFTGFNYGNSFSGDFNGNFVYPNGGDQPHNHGETFFAGNELQSLLQPTIAKYVWERIA